DAHENASEPSLQASQTAMSWSSAHVRTMPSDPSLQVGPPILGVSAPVERDIPFPADRQQQPRNRLQVAPFHPPRHTVGPVVGIGSQVRRDPLVTSQISQQAANACCVEPADLHLPHGTPPQ